MSRGATGGGAILGGSSQPRELSIGGILYDRVGVDQSRRTYYAAETAEGYALAEKPQRGDAVATERIPHEALGGFLERVGNRIGWTEIEPEWRQRSFDGGDGQ